MNRPTYSDVRAVIERFAPDVLTLFADGWERFPSGQAADAIITELTNQVGYWERAQLRRVSQGIDPGTAQENAQAIASAIAELERRR